MAAESITETAGGKKARGAFFTPATIASYLAEWAIGDDPEARVLDPTCGEAVFLVASARHLTALGAASEELDEHVYGVDIHGESLAQASDLLEYEGLDATLYEDDFFNVSSPAQLGCPFPLMDAVIGNPPFIRYQSYSGDQRKRAHEAALREGVRMSGLASSWAPLLVHASSFLKPNGRIAMVLPAELLTVQYAEPVRVWLRQRFASVSLVFFERLQFDGVQENVVLLLAHGSGGCDAFSLYGINDADELARLRPFDHVAVTPAESGKWTDLLLSVPQRQTVRAVTDEFFTTLGAYGSLNLGTVTGANRFFTLSDQTRTDYDIPERDVLPISPPGTKHLQGLSFCDEDWKSLRANNERVWLFSPSADRKLSEGAQRYIDLGTSQGVDQAYKCRVRDPWWRPPAVAKPDLFVSYMSHWFPRLVENAAGAGFLNSMHGLRLSEDNPSWVATALPLISINALSMLGAELHGRSYGGGLLKMEPREADLLPVPKPDVLARTWNILEPKRPLLDSLMRNGDWREVQAVVDSALFSDTLDLPVEKQQTMFSALDRLRSHRMHGRN